MRAALRSTDTEVIELSNAERERFRAAVAPVVEAQGARLGTDWLDALAD